MLKPMLKPLKALAALPRIRGLALAPAFLLMSTSALAQGGLEEVRAATAGYHRLEVAEQDHYHPRPGLEHCIQSPNPALGAMGYHFFDATGIDDIAPPDPRRPEGLVYAPGPGGQVRLAAVEWVVPSGPWHAAGNLEPPSVLGMEMHILNPALGWYIFHAWVWQHNPAGMFEDWNPDVHCN